MSLENESEGKMTEEQEKPVNQKNKSVQKIFLYAAVSLFIGFILLDKILAFSVKFPYILDLAYGIFFAVLVIYWFLVIQAKVFYGRRGMSFEGKTAVWIGVIGMLGSVAIAIKFFLDYISRTSGS